MEHTPKNFALQAGALITLYVSISSFIVLLFGTINLLLPDVAFDYWQYQGAEDGIRYSIAMLVVFFPTYLLLTRTVNQAKRKESNLYFTLTRWVVYISLLVGGLVILGDLVAVILAFLNGELTTRFLLKAGVLLVTVGAAFEYYRRDVQGYWDTREKTSVQIGVVTTLIVITAVVFGFMQINKPSDVREQKIDEQQVNDLRNLQYSIEDHYQRTKSLPDSIEEMYGGYGGAEAPQGRDAYAYEVTSENSYQLCATFAKPSNTSEQSIAKPAFDSMYNPDNYNWQHEAGRHCFEREVTPLEE